MREGNKSRTEEEQTQNNLNDSDVQIVFKLSGNNEITKESPSKKKILAAKKQSPTIRSNKNTFNTTNPIKSHSFSLTKKVNNFVKENHRREYTAENEEKLKLTRPRQPQAVKLSIKEKEKLEKAKQEEIAREKQKKKEELKNFIRTNNFIKREPKPKLETEEIPVEKILSPEEKMELMEHLVKNREDEIIKDVQKEVIKKGKEANEKIQR